MIPLAGFVAKRTGSVLLKKGDSVVGRFDESMMRRIAQVGCFVAGTLVATDEGPQPIETILAGRRVWAYDPRSKRWTLEPVVAPLLQQYAGTFVTVTTSGGDTITSTSTHPYWVTDGDGLEDRPKAADVPEHEQALPGGRWVEAGDLRTGDVLRLRSGGTSRVASLDKRNDVREVYNLWVNDVHTYAVGESGVVVHNNSEECAKVVLKYTKGIPSPRLLNDQPNGAYTNWLKKFYYGATATTSRPPALQPFFGPSNKEIFRRAADGSVDTSVVRDFDMFDRNVWYEIKSGSSLENMSWRDFTDSVDDGLSVAKSHGAIYKWITNGPIGPDKASYLTKHGIDVVKTLGD